MAKTSSSSSSSSTSSVKHKAFTGVGNLIKLLPTGTVFIFQFLNPVLTNNGKCHTVNKYLTSVLIGACGLSCCFSSFTDSYTDSKGDTHYGVATGKFHTVNKYLTSILIGACGLSCCLSSFTDSYTDSKGDTHYGVATSKGLWPSSKDSKDLSSYKLRIGDFVHAFFSTIVFLVVALLDSNTVACFYPSFVSTEKVLMMVLPAVIGAVSSSVFMIFPNNRHGIGYPSSSQASSSQKS
ncbi:hypothetical protein RJ640_014955 [Escallonia rubra]|uniref:Uncharacterized protein n=1 Tax=Escallonia rubra TaxID=112253 RepID=A0AA88S3Q4_9ASTE|nr:hypothetical protein RJ640_014955 [Escallonia rubra]